MSDSEKKMLRSKKTSKASLCIVRFSEDQEFPNLLVNNNLPIPIKNRKYLKATQKQRLSLSKKHKKSIAMELDDLNLQQ